jgi:predicted nucleic acid-binding protein
VIILDTNVISGLMREVPNPAVLAWAGGQRRENLVTTVINLMELRFGVENLLASRRRSELEAALDRTFSEYLSGRVLTFDLKAAHAAAVWQASRRRQGMTVPTTDAQIAGTAISRRIPIAMRDIRDFEGLPVKVSSPWDAPAA